MTNRSASSAIGRTRSDSLVESALVSAGGALGAVARALVGASVGAGGGPAWAATQLVNLSGAFVLGLLTGWLEARGPRPRLRAFLAIGFLGAFTTFSALVGSEQGVPRTTSSSVVAGIIGLELLGSLALGIGFFRLGQALVEWVVPRPAATSGPESRRTRATEAP
jgi:fluoride exporter